MDRSAGDRAAPDKEYTMDGEKLDTAEAKAYRFVSERKVEQQVKVLIKNLINLAIFVLYSGKQFLPISFQIQLLECFPQKQKEQRQKQL